MYTIKVSIKNNKNRKCLAANRCAARTKFAIVTERNREASNEEEEEEEEEEEGTGNGGRTTSIQPRDRPRGTLNVSVHVEKPHDRSPSSLSSSSFFPFLFSIIVNLISARINNRARE